MADDGRDRLDRWLDGAMIAVVVIVAILFVYSMVDAYLLSVNERPFANPLARLV